MGGSQQLIYDTAATVEHSSSKHPHTNT